MRVAEAKGRLVGIVIIIIIIIIIIDVLLSCSA